MESNVNNTKLRFVLALLIVTMGIILFVSDSEF